MTLILMAGHLHSKVFGLLLCQPALHFIMKLFLHQLEQQSLFLGPTPSSSSQTAPPYTTWPVLNPACQLFFQQRLQQILASEHQQNIDCRLHGSHRSCLSIFLSFFLSFCSGRLCPTCQSMLLCPLWRICTLQLTCRVSLNWCLDSAICT